jgi:hypothetical protein
MDNNSRIAIISEQLDELHQLIQNFRKYPKQVYRIDVDLALEKLRRIYEDLSRIEIQSNASNQDLKKEVTVQNETLKENLRQEFPVEFSLQNEPDFSVNRIPETIEEVREVPTEIKQKESPTALIDLFSAPVSEKKISGKKTIVEKIAGEKPVEIVADKIGKNKISGLNQAIGINEKFFFINELFEGDMKEYKTAIDTLDRAESLERAVEFMHKLAENHGWDKTQEAYGKLMDFVERKFQ